MERSVPYGWTCSGAVTVYGKLTPERAETFICENTALVAPPHVPELRLHLADESHALWLKTEEELDAIGLPPPFWAFAWAGGQGLARYILDHPQIVADKTVLDFASGSGLVAIAAMKSGARECLAADIDPFCATAIRLNSGVNGVKIAFAAEDQTGRDDGWDIVLAGDVFYSKPFAESLIPWFEALVRRGALVLIGDPGRSYLPRQRLAELAVYQVQVTRDLEDAEVKKTTVWRFG